MSQNLTIRYLLYNSAEDAPDTISMQLSDNFCGEGKTIYSSI